MQNTRLRTARALILLFMLGLIASGLTAIPLQSELRLMDRWLGSGSSIAPAWPALAEWISRVNWGVQQAYGDHPFLAYGTDWLAFGHIAIATAFIGALRDPERNVWVIEFGIIACVLVLPWALVFGALRGIPPLWQMIDMAFGAVGMMPLWAARSLARRSISASLNGLM